MHLAEAGAYTLLSGRTAAAMEDTKKEIEEAGGIATVITSDVRDVSQIYGLVDAAVEANGHLDIMVNKPASPTQHRSLKAIPKSGALCSKQTSWPFSSAARPRSRQ